MTLRRLGKRVLQIVAVLFFLVLLAGTGSLFLIALPFLLALGWVGYLVRVVPEVSWAWGELLGAVVCVVVLGFGAHHGLRWLWRAWGSDSETGRGKWKPAWTGSLVAGVVLLFAANIAVIGTVHQLGWLASGRVPLLRSSWGGPDFRARKLCTHVRQIGSADEIRSLLWRDPAMRRSARGLNVLARERPDGTIVTAIFPRGPADLALHGIRLCARGTDLDGEVVPVTDGSPAQALYERGFFNAPAESAAATSSAPPRGGPAGHRRNVPVSQTVPR